MPTEQDRTQILPSPQRPLVSFILPVWNLDSGLVTQAVESILQLDMKPAEREIILVDDGSNQLSFDPGQPWADEVVFVRQPHAGPSVARNRGLDIARGRFIQFVDADDCLCPRAYNHCLDIIRQGEAEVVMFQQASFETDPQAVMVALGASVKSSNAFRDAKSVSGPHYMRHHNLRGSVCGFLFDARLLGRLRFTPGILREDEEFVPLLLIRTTRLVETSATAYLYRQRPDSLMHRHDEAFMNKAFDDTFDIIRRLQHKAATLPHNMRSALNRRVNQLAMDYLYNVMTYKSQEGTDFVGTAVSRLKSIGLYPLPVKNYTPKYAAFSMLTATTLGRKAVGAGLRLFRGQ
ncbi:MAG: glycosyltransferase family 2 protein [Prevotella sp.]|jgi:glycosyltransferase involved in cell wall biosynthesis